MKFLAMFKKNKVQKEPLKLSLTLSANDTNDIRVGKMLQVAGIAVSQQTMDHLVEIVETYKKLDRNAWINNRKRFLEKYDQHRSTDRSSD